MTEEEKKEKIVYKTPPKMSFVMGILAGIVVAAIVGLFMMFLMNNNDDIDEANITNTNTTAKVNINSAPAAPVVVDIKAKDDDHVRGDKDAKVTMIQYSDFECPFCGRVVPTTEKILKEYDGKVKLIYRHFPLSSHKSAQKAAEASECAADQGKFWEMHDLMFDNQDSLSVDDLKGYASDLGLNTSTFNNCLENGEKAQKVNDDLAEGIKFGVKGTPATFVNGTMISGAQPYASFASAIDAALAK